LSHFCFWNALYNGQTLEDNMAEKEKNIMADEEK
jgi:hypothetical protein